MKKFLAMLLAVAMVMGMAPAAFAVEADGVIDTEAELKDAVAAGGEIVLGGDIELTASITVNGTVVLDLNGKTLSYDSTTMGEAMITNKGTLTINDSSDPDTGVINYNYTGAADSSYGKGNYTISNAGTLTVNGGEITIANLSGHAKYPIDNNSTTGDAVLVINGGHLYNYNTSAIRMFCNSTTNQNSVTINGGMIEGYCAIWMQNPGKNTVNGSLSITGGEIKSTAKAYVNGTSALTEVSSCMYTTIDGDGGAWSEGSFVKLTGGVFNENVNFYYDAPQAIIGAGATFNGNVWPTYEAFVDTDADGVQDVGETAYDTLAAAIAAAEAGDTVTLLKDVTMGVTDAVANCSIAITQAITLDGNGKTLTSTAARAINVKTEGKVTIQNLTINASGERAINVITYPAELTIDNVTASGASYAVNVASAAGAAKIAITDSNLSGNIVLNVWNANGTINVTDSVLTGVDKAEVESYSTVKLNNDGINAAEGTVININGGSVTAEDDSFAVMNQTQSGKINISGTTSVTGETKLFPEYSTLVIYKGSTQFYACATLQDAIDTASKDLETAFVRLTADVELIETVTNPNGVEIDKNGHEIKAAAGYTLTVSEDGKVYTVTKKPTPSAPPAVTPDPEPEVPEIEAPTVDTDAPVVDSTTTENEDGSTTKEETLENGTKVETTTNTDGSKTETATKSETVETEESKTTTTTTVTTNTSATGETVTESTEEVKVENADGSATTTTTTVVESEAKTEKTEIKEETVVNEDGSTETTVTAATETVLANGSTGTTTTDETGKVEAEVTVSSAAVQEAAKEDLPVELAMPAVEAAKPADEVEAPTVTVDLPAGITTATVAIPVAEGTGAGTVAVIVNADGTETVLTESVVTENGLEVEVPDGATIKVIDNSTDFNDIEDEHWHKDAVDFNSAREIMNGVEGNNFAPDTVTTRAMVWTMLARLAGVDTTTGETWYEVGREWAMANGISDGTNGDVEITREQLATMLYRYIGSPEHDYEIDRFHDHDETNEWALEGKKWAVGVGVINGKGNADGTVSLDPTGEATRAEVAQMMMNFITKVQ